MKKIAAFAGAAALLASVAMPSFASTGWKFFMPKSTQDVTVANVNNYAEADAISGGNIQSNAAVASSLVGGWTKAEVEGTGQTTVTGASNADADAVVIANTKVGTCGCLKLDPCACKKSTKVIANVTNGALAGAQSGVNAQGNSASATSLMGGWTKAEVEGTGQTTVTGESNSDADAWSVVNTDLSFGWMPKF